jgi:hypothetical protein
MSSILGSLRKIVNDTAVEILDSEVPQRVAGVLNTLVNSVFEVVDDVLVQVRDLTEEKPEEEEEEAEEEEEEEEEATEEEEEP